MSWTRIKTVNYGDKKYCYAYKVKSVWNKELKQSRQKVVKYIGKVEGLEPYFVKEVFERDMFQCMGRGCFSEDELTVDHKIPLSKGGSNDIINLQTLCLNCNQKKRDLVA